MRASDVQRLVAHAVAVAAVLAMLIGCIECGVIETNETGDSEYLGVKIYPIERHCAMVGGICVHKTDCAEGTSTSGLCPRSRHLGVECCYSVISQPATCANLLGACMNWCNPDLVQDQATDCAAGQKCCTLVS